MPTQAPRVNVVVTPEQHALLSEFAQLDPDVRSAAGFLRSLLDQVTPLLRVTVEAMRVAAQEKDKARGDLADAMGAVLAELRQRGLFDEAAPVAVGRTERSEGAPPKRRRLRRSTSASNTQGQ
jgi:hypothetical protein